MDIIDHTKTFILLLYLKFVFFYIKRAEKQAIIYVVVSKQTPVYSNETM